MARDIEQTVDQMIGRTVGMRESHLQEHVRQAALYGHWLYFHTFDSRRSPEGFPDVVALRDDQLVVAELKSAGKHPTAKQAQWLDAFRILEALFPDNVHVFVWRPSDLAEIDQVLLGKRAPPKRVAG